MSLKFIVAGQFYTTPAASAAVSPGGASGALQFNNAGAFGGVSGWTTDGANVLTGGVGTSLAIGGATIGANALAVTGTTLLNGALSNAAAGAASVPASLLSGAWFTGGSATTTKPQLLIEPAGTTTTNWSTSGTGLGINAANGFSGRLIDAQVNAVSKMRLDTVGNIFAVGGVYLESTLGSGNRAAVLENTAGAGRLYINANGQISFTNAANAGDSRDVLLGRDAAGVLYLQNGTNACSYRAYGTTTGPRYGIYGHDGTDSLIGPSGGGTIKLSGLTAAADAALVSTHSITVKDTTGTSYKLMAVAV